MDIEAIPLLCVIAADLFPFSYHHVFPSAGISVHPTDIPAGAPGDRQQCPSRDRAQSVRGTFQRPLDYVWISFRRSSARLWSVSPLHKRYINFQSVGELFSFRLSYLKTFCRNVSYTWHWDNFIPFKFKVLERRVELCNWVVCKIWLKVDTKWHINSAL